MQALHEQLASISVAHFNSERGHVVLQWDDFCQHAAGLARGRRMFSRGAAAHGRQDNYGEGGDSKHVSVQGHVFDGKHTYVILG
jgi:hypothetical protein